MSTRQERLNKLANLQPGWLDGHGKAIPPTVIEAATEFISLLEHSDAHQDYGIFPTEHGHILIEWTNNSSLLEAEINEHYTEIFYVSKGSYTETRFLLIEDAAEHINTTIPSL